MWLQPEEEFGKQECGREEVQDLMWYVEKYVGEEKQDFEKDSSDLLRPLPSI